MLTPIRGDQTDFPPMLFFWGVPCLDLHEVPVAPAFVLVQPHCVHSQTRWTKKKNTWEKIVRSHEYVSSFAGSVGMVGRAVGLMPSNFRQFRGLNFFWYVQPAGCCQSHHINDCQCSTCFSFFVSTVRKQTQTKTIEIKPLETKEMWNPNAGNRGRKWTFRAYRIKNGIVVTIKPNEHSCQKLFGNSYLHACVKNPAIAYPKLIKIVCDS